MLIYKPETITVKHNSLITNNLIRTSMKKFLFKFLSVLMALVLLVAQQQIVSAKTIKAELPSLDESVFDLNENALDAAMQELNELDNYLGQHQGMTFDDLQAAGSELISNVSNSVVPMGMAQDGEAPLGIAPFLWGCVLGWVGLLIVYLVTDGDKAQTKKALTGCLVGTGVEIVLYVLLYAVAWNTTSNSLGYY